MMLQALTIPSQGTTRRGALFGLFFACLACRTPVAEGQPVPAPTASFDVSDAELFADDFQPAIDRVTRSHPQFDGLSLAAASRVDTTARTTLPLALLEASNGVRDWDTASSQNTVLVALDLVDGTVRAANAKPIRGGKRYDPRTLPRSRDGEMLPSAHDMRSVGLIRLDARSLLSMPWGQGRYAFTVLQQDWRSNLVSVELAGKPAKEPTELSFTVEELGLLAARSQAAGVLSSLPDTPEDSLSLALSPTETGIVASGSFRLKVPEHARLSKAVTDSLHAKAGKTPVPSALVRVTLLVLVRDNPHPQPLELQVPVYTEQDGIGRAHFSVALSGGDAEPVSSGDHHVWAVAADRVFGPFPLTVK